MYIYMYIEVRTLCLYMYYIYILYILYIIYISTILYITFAVLMKTTGTWLDPRRSRRQPRWKLCLARHMIIPLVVQ